MQIVPHYETHTNYFCVFHQIVRNLEVADCSDFIRLERGFYINLWVTAMKEITLLMGNAKLYKYLDVKGGLMMLHYSNHQFTNATRLNNPFDC